jgi:hypothetical protein
MRMLQEAPAAGRPPQAPPLWRLSGQGGGFRPALCALWHVRTCVRELLVEGFGVCSPMLVEVMDELRPGQRLGLRLCSNLGSCRYGCSVMSLVTC